MSEMKARAVHNVYMTREERIQAHPRQSTLTSRNASPRGWEPRGGEGAGGSRALVGRAKNPREKKLQNPGENWGQIHTRVRARARDTHTTRIYTTHQARTGAMRDN